MRLDTKQFNTRIIKHLRRYFFASGRDSRTALHQHASRSCHVARHSRVTQTQRRPAPKITTMGRYRRYAFYQGKSRHTLGTTESTWGVPGASSPRFLHATALRFKRTLRLTKSERFSIMGETIHGYHALSQAVALYFKSSRLSQGQQAREGLCRTHITSLPCSCTIYWCGRKEEEDEESDVLNLTW